MTVRRIWSYEESWGEESLGTPQLLARDDDEDMEEEDWDEEEGWDEEDDEDEDWDEDEEEDDWEDWEEEDDEETDDRRAGRPLWNRRAA